MTLGKAPCLTFFDFDQPSVSEIWLFSIALGHCIYHIKHGYGGKLPLLQADVIDTASGM